MPETPPTVATTGCVPGDTAGTNVEETKTPFASVDGAGNGNAEIPPMVSAVSVENPGNPAPLTVTTSPVVALLLSTERVGEIV